MSKVEENMQEAKKRDAARQGKFYFRKDILTGTFKEWNVYGHANPRVGTVPEWVSWRVGGDKFFLRVFLLGAFCAVWLAIFFNSGVSFCTGLFITDPTTRPFYKKWFGLGKREYTKMSLNDIFNGVENEFPGLIPLVEDYLKDLHLDVHSSCTLHRYLRFISKKASGKLFPFLKKWTFTIKKSHFFKKKNFKKFFQKFFQKKIKEKKIFKIFFWNCLIFEEKVF